jgi:hypothetical protein
MNDEYALGRNLIAYISGLLPSYEALGTQLLPVCQVCQDST